MKAATCCPLPSLEDLHGSLGLRKAHGMLGDPSHPEQGLFELLFHANKSESKQVKNLAEPRLLSKLEHILNTQLTWGFLHYLNYCESGMFDVWYVYPYN